MTKVGKMYVKCAKCGEESAQMIVYSVNYGLGSREDNDKLLNHTQKCPKCGYEAIDISINDEEKNNSYLDNLIKKIDSKIEKLEKEEKEIEDTTNLKLARYEKAFKEIKRIIDSLEEEEIEVVKKEEPRKEQPTFEQYLINTNRQRFDQTPSIIEDTGNDDLINERRIITGLHRRHTIGIVEKPNISTLEEHHEPASIEEKKEVPNKIEEEDVIAIYISLMMNDAKYIFEINKEEDITIKCAIDDIVETKKLDESEYSGLIKTLFIIKKKWDNRYDSKVENEDWSVEIVSNEKVESYEGSGIYPNNWPMFKEFVNILLTKFN